MSAHAPTLRQLARALLDVRSRPALVPGVLLPIGGQRDRSQRPAGPLRSIGRPGEQLPHDTRRLLGLGDNGHTASLIPDRTAVCEKERWVVVECVAEVSMWPVEPRRTRRTARRGVGESRSGGTGWLNRLELSTNDRRYLGAGQEHEVSAARHRDVLEMCSLATLQAV